MEFLKKHSKTLTFFILLFLFWGQYFVFGIARSADTISFEIFSPLVYPLYSVTLWVFRTLFGEDRGYFLLGLFQNLLLVLALVSFNDYIKKAFELDCLTHGLLLLVSAGIFFAQKFLTRSGMVTSNTLFSEALTIPFYLFFFRYFLQAILEKNKKAFRYGCLFVTGIILCRAQLYWLLVVVFLVRLYICDSKRKQALVSAVLVCALIAGAIQGTRVIQNFSVDDDQSKVPSNLYLLSTAVYCSYPEDSALFPLDSPERDLFNLTHQWMDVPERQAAYSYETGDFTERHLKFEAYYDHVKGVLGYYYRELVDQGRVADMSTMFVVLVKANIKDYLAHCLHNGLTGLIRTVAILRPGINALAGLFYLYLVVCLLIARKNKNLTKEYRLACLGLLCALMNALVMAPGVFALSRYMFYNMLILYTTAILFLRALILEWKRVLRGEKRCPTN